MAGKKGSINLSINVIVIIIISFVLLILLISFIRSNIDKASIKLEEQLVVGAPKPTVEIRKPFNKQIFVVGEEIQFEPFAFTQTKKSKIIGYFWYFGDGREDNEEKTSHIYYEPGDYPVTLKVLNDLGGLGEAAITVRIFTNNTKKLSRYPENLVFFIPSERTSSGVVNWENILKAIPITKWYNRDGYHEFEYIAAIKGASETVISNNDIKKKLDEFNATRTITEAVVFDTASISSSISASGGGSYNIRKEGTSESDADIINYFEYWDNYDNVVLINSSNNDGALIASLFAAYLNAPLVFIDKTFCERHDTLLFDVNNGYLYGKIAYRVDDFTSEIMAACIDGKLATKTIYTSDELKDPNRKVNRIITLTSELDVVD
jgi:PKD repeat protein